MASGLNQNQGGLGQEGRRVNGKVIVAGPANAGKTCLIERFVNNVYAADDPSHGPTLGCDCLQKSLQVDGTEVHLFLYDTAGQERFADMAAAYYRIGEVCLLCFDMSNPSSFDNTRWWMSKVVEYNSHCALVLVGTKEDLVTPAASEMLSAIVQWADDAGIPYFPTSALRGGEHIKFLFHAVAEKTVRLAQERQLQGVAADGRGRLQSPFGLPGAPGGCC